MRIFGTDEQGPTPVVVWPAATVPTPVPPNSSSTPSQHPVQPKPAPKTAEPAPAKPTYYTYKSQVSLKPGQTLGFTPGKGYYVKDAMSVSHTNAPKAKAPKQQPKPQSASTKSGGETGYYTYRDDVQLKPGQTIGFVSGKGYYARDVVTKGSGLRTTHSGSPTSTRPTRPNERSGHTTRRTQPQAPIRSRKADAQIVSVQGIARELSGEMRTRAPRALRPINPHVKLPPIPKRSRKWSSNAGREEVAFHYLSKQLGPRLKPIHIAALVGNMMYESTNYLSKKTPHPVLVSNLGEIGGGGGYGIAQWTQATRVSGLREFARDHDLPVSNFGLQLAYVVLELRSEGELIIGGVQKFTLSTSRFTATLATKRTLKAATDYVMTTYESPKPGSEPTRRKYANQILRRFAHR